MRLSVVIPTLRRHEELRRVLDGLEQQDTGPDAFEVLVAVDPDEEDLPAVEGLVADRPYAARCVARDRPGVAAARNTGWRSARAPLVLFLDDDVVPTRGLVTAHLAWHDRHPGDEVGVLGRVDWAPEVPRTPFRRWVEDRTFHFTEIEGDEAGYGRLYTANVSFKRALLEAVDGFDAEGLPFGYEDIDLGLRMHREHGLRLMYAREALGLHLHEMTLDGWRRRVVWLASAERAFCEKHPDARPWWWQYFSKYAHIPRSRGRLARLAGAVPPWVPWLGPRVWRSYDISVHQALAPLFFEAWDAGASEDDHAVTR